eukprot:TRINITY_DN24329_c0_g1_i2.p1 TRINITY_DN24329_c0_g1~~TRINITY_DN24329_c0_g1_i2.p1  ORF type:complete len:112 (+),score=4.77 TRINITY_DN24329_c0_g1_i2:228-563(+)
MNFRGWSRREKVVITAPAGISCNLCKLDIAIGSLAVNVKTRHLQKVPTAEFALLYHNAHTRFGAFERIHCMKQPPVKVHNTARARSNIVHDATCRPYCSCEVQNMFSWTLG